MRGALAEKQLQAAGGPGIAAGLGDIGLAEAGVEAAGPAGKCGAGGEEVIV